MCPNSNHTPPSTEDRHPAPDLKRQTLVHDFSRRLSYGDLPTKIQAARDIRKLVRASSKTQTAFAVASIVESLVSMMSAPQAEAKEVAVLAILNIAARNDRNKNSIVTLGAVPPLVELFKHENSRLKELATASILTLSSSNCNKSTIVASGAPELLVQVLSSGSIQGRVDAVTALYNLSTFHEGFDPSIYVESVVPLLTLLKDSKKHSKFAEKATALLEMLCDSDKGREAIATYDGGILILVETIEDGSLLSVENAAGILLTLCRSCREKFRELILNEGAIPGILILTAYGTESAQEKARNLLELLRDDSKPNRMTPEDLQTIVFDLASQVDGPEKASETAGMLLKDMARRNRELTLSNSSSR